MYLSITHKEYYLIIFHACMSCALNKCISLSLMCHCVKRDNKKRSKCDTAVVVTPEALKNLHDQYTKWKKKQDVPPNIASTLNVLDTAYACGKVLYLNFWL